jgi:hypothetical protein
MTLFELASKIDEAEFMSDLVLRNKDNILPHFEEWVETFEPVYYLSIIDEDEEYELEMKYKFMCGLLDALKDEHITEEQADAILFHVLQISYDEDKIKLI